MHFRFAILFRHQSVRSLATKLLNFPSFSHSLTEHTVPIPAKHIVYPIAYKLINALKLHTNPSHTGRNCETKAHDGAKRGRRRIYVKRSHWLFALRCHFGARSELHSKPTAAEHSFVSVRVASFLRGMQTVMDDLRSGPVFFYGETRRN